MYNCYCLVRDSEYREKRSRCLDSQEASSCMAKMVSIAAAADHYEVSRQTVRRWIANGKITAHRVGPRLIRIDLDEIEAKIIHTVPTVLGTWSVPDTKE
jgi:excisionase family DNA binding protein